MDMCCVCETQRRCPYCRRRYYYCYFFLFLVSRCHTQISCVCVPISMSIFVSAIRRDKLYEIYIFFFNFHPKFNMVQPKCSLKAKIYNALVGPCALSSYFCALSTANERSIINFFLGHGEFCVWYTMARIPFVIFPSFCAFGTFGYWQ